jgi:hypothetical protein
MKSNLLRFNPWDVPLKHLVLATFESDFIKLLNTNETPKLLI